jgi:excisionase family DNA binding protein
MSTSLETLLTLDELSESLKVSKSSLYKMAQAGRIPGTKIGKHWRFHKQTIDQWIDGNSQKCKKLGNG